MVHGLWNLEDFLIFYLLWVGPCVGESSERELARRVDLEPERSRQNEVALSFGLSTALEYYNDVCQEQLGDGWSWRFRGTLLTRPLPCNQWRIYASCMSSHKPIRVYMRGLILGVNTLYRLFCFFKLFPMVGKGLINGHQWGISIKVLSQRLLTSNVLDSTGLLFSWFISKITFQLEYVVYISLLTRLKMISCSTRCVSTGTIV